MGSRSTFRRALQLTVLIVVGSACVAAPAERNAVAVYRCHIDGVLTFSDRPCDAAAQRHAIDTEGINTSVAPAMPKSSGKPAKQPRQRKSGSTLEPDPKKQAQICERLAQSLKDIRSKMRAGYKASEGERLKDRQAKLKNQLRLARCS